jgi:hypothetical protein
MKFFSFMAMSLFSAASVFAQIDGIAVPQPMTVAVAKGHHRGPRGHRGHMAVVPAYIETIEVADPQAPFPLSVDTIIPLGNTPSGLSPQFLEYVDSDPTSPTADRYIHVLKGGAGKYLIVWSITGTIFPQVSRQLDALYSAPLITRLEVGNDAGVYNMNRSPDDYFLFQDLSGDPEVPALRSTGTRSDIVTLHEGDRVHLRVLQVPTIEQMMLSSLDHNSRCVNVTMTRISSRTHHHRG